jgi:ornithine cyclodeaminase/alanine dehydrogenase
VAIRYLAAPQIAELGLFGTGWQARAQLAAAVAARPIRRAIVYGRDADRRLRFADEMSHELNIEVRAAEHPQQAAENLPLVITATTSRDPVVFGKWLADETLVCAIGSNWLNRAEIDVEVVTRASAVVCDSVAACRIEAGDFTAAIQQQAFDWSSALELSDIVAGRATLPDRSGIKIFKSVGLALEDVALGGKFLNLARAQGLGQLLPF